MAVGMIRQRLIRTNSVLGLSAEWPPTGRYEIVCSLSSKGWMMSSTQHVQDGSRAAFTSARDWLREVIWRRQRPSYEIHTDTTDLLYRRSCLMGLIVALTLGFGLPIAYGLGAFSQAAPFGISQWGTTMLLWLAGGFVAVAIYAAFDRFVLQEFGRTLIQLASHNRRFEATLDNMSQGVAFFDGNQRLLIANRRFAEIYGLAPDALKPGDTLREIVQARVATKCLPNMTPEEYVRSREALVSIKEPTESLIELQDGRFITIHHRPIPGSGWVSTHEDVTERHGYEERLREMAHHDALTGLPNRRRFHECLAECAATHGQKESIALLCLDLDRFKQVNDTYGHPIGDELLCAVAARLQECVRKEDMIVRLGGDEFGILQMGARQPIDARLLAQRIIEEIGRPFALRGQAVIVGVSVGIALGRAGYDFDLLLKNADLALYRAKTEGRGNSCIFRPELRQVMTARTALEADLRQALIRQEFELMFQPLLDTTTETVSSLEALIRWRHPVRGLVLPADFIPLAEEIGLIVPIGKWVLAEACREAVKWLAPIRVAVNLSRAQMENDIVSTVQNAIASSGLAPERLELEITESVLLQISPAVLESLQDIRKTGVTITLDNFGTGYSPLNYQQKFPVDKIKIDKSFIQEIGKSQEALNIVRAIIQFGMTMHIKLNAEGVETTEQFQLLQDEGCEEVQGFLFSRPVSAGSLPFLGARHQLRAALQTARTG